MDEQKAHGHALRRGRHSQIHQIYLITSCTHERQTLFSDWELGRIVVNCLRESDALQLTKTKCFVVMPDHLH